MHRMAAEEIIKICQQRVREGDHPTVPAASIEQLEGCVLELTLQLEVFRADEPAIEAYKLFRKERRRREAAEENCASWRPVAYMTKTGLENWMKGDSPENHVLLRTDGDLRVPLYTDAPTPPLDDPERD